ncbi:MAG: alkaline phosphatase family protein [Firmicutes bacterium]|nr:alkaline phosphatase family protein [Bacillota bacterium]
MKRFYAIFLLLVVCFFTSFFTSCVPSYSIFLNGDIVEKFIEITINGDTPLDETLKKITPRAADYKLLISAKNDGQGKNNGTSALIDGADAKFCMLYKNEDGGINLSAPKHPAVAGIKNILDITVICGGLDDFRVLYPYGFDGYSFGETKLAFYSAPDESIKTDAETGYKYKAARCNPKAINVGDFIEDESKIYAYFDDFGIEKADLAAPLTWKNGRIYYKNNTSPVFGFLCGADNFVGDAYYAMKDAIDGNRKVITVLADGLSLEQVRRWADELTLLKSGYKFAASTHIAKTQVATAAILTGKTPRETGVTTGLFKTPLVPDIFTYVKQKGRTAAYILGTSNVIGTPDIQPILAGETDLAVKNKALTKRGENPDLLFVHFKDIDLVNHEFSPQSEQSLAKILEIEGYIKELIEGFKGRLIIVPDHGHITLDEGGVTVGNHALFMPGDMFVPYYVFEC